MSSNAENAITEIRKVLNRRIVGRHSIFQLKYFVIGREPTHQRRMWKCLQELKLRMDGIDAIDQQIEEAKDNIELAHIAVKREEMRMNNFKPDSEADLLLQQELTINAKKQQRACNAQVQQLERLRESRREQFEEATFFLEMYKKLEESEQLKDWDDSAIQQEYFNERYAQELNMRVLLSQPLDMELIRCIMAMSDDTPIKKQLVGLLEAHHQALLAMQKQSNEKVEAFMHPKEIDGSKNIDA